MLDPLLLPVPLERFSAPAGFVKTMQEAPEALFYFLLNVGDGDTQLLLLPEEEDPENGKPARRAVVVDIATVEKLPALIESLIEQDLLPERRDLFSVVVGTHPHDDHIGGMPEFIDRFGDYIGEYWEPGYYHPTGAYVETMRALEARPHILHTQPTGGMARFIGRVKLLTLTPGITLRTRFDSYGTEINDSSITLKVEYPAARIIQRRRDRTYLRVKDPWSIILGADAQTTAWAQATIDFPHLHRDAALYREMRAAQGADWLRAQIFKVPHHGSKHGVNIELVERIRPNLCLFSSTGGAGRYNFPHPLALGAVREGLDPSYDEKGLGDHDLGIHHTAAVDVAGTTLGSIAIMVPPKRGARLRMWRFGDASDKSIELEAAREFLLRTPERTPSGARSK